MPGSFSQIVCNLSLKNKGLVDMGLFSIGSRKLAVVTSSLGVSLEGAGDVRCITI